MFIGVHLWLLLIFLYKSVIRATQMNVDAQCLHHGNFYGQRVVGGLC